MKTKLFSFLMFLLAFTATNAQINSVAIVGEGVEANGWPGQANNPGPIDKHQLTKVVGTTDVWQITNFKLVGGSVKFRANNSWDAAPNGGNWGKPLTGSAFPIGVGAENSGGSQNIPAVAGTYDITFNSTTGNYNFSGGPAIAVVKLLGTATTPATGITMDTADGITYTLGTTTLLAGNAQFSVDGVIVGATAFPSGTATGVPTDFIPVVAGKYTSVTFNKDSGAYTFVAAPVFNSLAIVGDGAGGWPGDPGVPNPDANVLTTTDGINYVIKNVALTVGGIKFRQNNNWTDTNWTGNAFPIGVLQVPGGNIAVNTAGNYDCFVNVVSGVYRFSLVSQPPVSLVGPGAGGWPGGTTPYPDTNVMTTTDGENYTLNNLVLTDGPIKFRQDYAWTTSWGGTAFPTGTPSGDNLSATAGTWNVTFKRSTGAYTFTSSLGVNKFDAASFKAYPNPTRSSWNIVSGNEDITSVRVFDVLGKAVYTKFGADKEVNVNASELSKGVYFAKVATANGESTLKLVKE
ncbi:T9SS type A sorting domain-containing protein [Flavobacterium nackdongense]|uniref:T9SS type A sorting domain-containing protein n=1 Tax=Flavobacterium nackdongense TaxID=2547394 RepID=A0A4P6Y831_9FLAO|nr:T9SS type A sorting domain-containing protein [Flavobacterium nackdongense]QBN18919.1 T9SS type A sorting domain-containing protein [Flavobacterium nackdongense]